MAALVCVHGVCVFTAVCVHFGWFKCRARILSMGHHTWLYVTHFHFLFHPSQGRLQCIYKLQFPVVTRDRTSYETNQPPYL